MIGQTLWVIRGKYAHAKVMCRYLKTGNIVRYIDRPSFYAIPRMFETYKSAELARLMRKRGYAKKRTKGVEWIQDNVDVNDLEVAPFRWVRKDEMRDGDSFYILEDSKTGAVMPETFIRHTSAWPEKFAIPRLFRYSNSAKMASRIWLKGTIVPWGRMSPLTRDDFDLQPIHVEMEYL